MFEVMNTFKYRPYCKKKILFLFFFKKFPLRGKLPLRRPKSKGGYKTLFKSGYVCAGFKNFKYFSADGGVFKSVVVSK